MSSSHKLATKLKAFQLSELWPAELVQYVTPNTEVEMCTVNAFNGLARGTRYLNTTLVTTARGQHSFLLLIAVLSLGRTLTVRSRLSIHGNICTSLQLQIMHLKLINVPYRSKCRDFGCTFRKKREITPIFHHRWRRLQQALSFLSWKWQ